VDAQAWDERYDAAELVWSVEPNQFVAAECAGLLAGGASGRSPDRALDLAAGEGRNAIWLARQGWQVCAADFSQAGLDKGRQLAGSLDIDWVCADAVTGQGFEQVSRGGAFGLVVIAYLQLPPRQRRAAIRRGFASLAPGGTFLLVAHATNLEHGTGGPQDASVLMTAEDVLADLAGEKYTVLRAERVERLVGDGHGGAIGATAYDCLVRLTRG
jgi:SAM-dependent methyltransferase